MLYEVITHIQVHAPLGIRENAIAAHLVQQPLRLGFVVAVFYPQQHQHAAAYGPHCLSLDPDTGVRNPFRITSYNVCYTKLLREHGDDEAKAERLLHKVSGYRIFPDAEGRMNLNVQQVGGSLLVVSQFTLAADTRKGMRPSFAEGAATPALAERLYDHFVDRARGQGLSVASGRFAADMQVSLTNDGPVTFWLQVTIFILSPTLSIFSFRAWRVL